jgi:hypothetical protein
MYATKYPIPLSIYYWFADASVLEARLGNDDADEPRGLLGWAEAR